MSQRNVSRSYEFARKSTNDARITKSSQTGIGDDGDTGDNRKMRRNKTSDTSFFDDGMMARTDYLHHIYNELDTRIGVFEGWKDEYHSKQVDDRHTLHRINNLGAELGEFRYEVRPQLLKFEEYLKNSVPNWNRVSVLEEKVTMLQTKDLERAYSDYKNGSINILSYFVMLLQDENTKLKERIYRDELAWETIAKKMQELEEKVSFMNTLMVKQEFEPVNEFEVIPDKTKGENFPPFKS
jgi:hypothetical protein